MSEKNQNSQSSHETPESQPAPEASQQEKSIDWQNEAEKFKNDFLYLRAEFENYKRNAIKERSDLLKYGGERLARDLVGVLDNFERAVAVEIKPEALENYTKGVQMTAQELKSVLERHGVKEVPSEKAPFDPAIHEALGSEVSTSVKDGHVLRVFEKPYRFHEKLLRVGRVIIARSQES